jgi:hypothetical protein
MTKLTKQELLEEALDALCKATGRDITIILPEEKSQVIPYLKAEILKTAMKIKNLELIKNDEDKKEN